MATKQANEGAALDPAAAGPDQEALAQAMGGQGGGAGDPAELLANLSPEELQALEQYIAQQSHGQIDPAVLAQALESEVGQHPEADVQGLPPEKAAGLASVKTAAYIEGFLTTALDHGLNVKQATAAYEDALVATIQHLRKEAGALAINSPVRRLVGKAKGYIKANPIKSTIAGTAAVGAGAAALSGGDSSDEKKAAFVDGLIARGAAYGLTPEQSVKLAESYL